MSKMLVSVIIPTYNRARTIERAINSVLAQTWKAIEIIVVDSHSNDRTLEVLAQYGDKVRVLSQPKLGPGFARNAGIKAASGEIISFLDSDDEWLPEKTERQVKLLQATESSGVNCCVCNARMNFISGTVYSFVAADLRPPYSEGIWMNPTEILITRFLFFNQVAAIRRAAFEKSGDFKSGIMEDYDLALRLSLLGPWAFINDPLVIWHEQAGDNLSRTHSQIEICRRTIEILKETSDSPQWGPLLPQGLLRSRLKWLKQGIEADRLSKVSNPLAKLAGNLRLQYQRQWPRVAAKLSSAPRMMTRAV